MKKTLQQTIIFLLSFSTAFGQYEGNSPALIKKLGIRSLMVCTDTACSSCPVDYNEYDSQGREIYHLEAMMEDRWEWFYSKDKLLFTTYYIQADDGTITMMDTTFFYYTKNGSLNYYVRKECSDGEKPITKFDTIWQITTKKPLINPTYKNGKLASHIVKGIHRSCLTPSPLDNTLKYYYKTNGLIDKIDIFKHTNELYMTWYFIYTDKGKYRRQ